MQARFIQVGGKLALVLPDDILERHRAAEGSPVQVSETADGRVLLEFGPGLQAKREDAEYLVPEQDQ